MRSHFNYSSVNQIIWRAEQKLRDNQYVNRWLIIRDVIRAGAILMKLKVARGVVTGIWRYLIGGEILI